MNDFSRLREIAGELRAMPPFPLPWKMPPINLVATELYREAVSLGTPFDSKFLADYAGHVVIMDTERSDIADKIELLLDKMDAHASFVALTAEDKTILETLDREHPMTVTQESLAADTRLSDRTVREHLKYLVQKQLVNQPRGLKKGYGLTDGGLAILVCR